MSALFFFVFTILFMEACWFVPVGFGFFALFLFLVAVSTSYDPGTFYCFLTFFFLWSLLSLSTVLPFEKSPECYNVVTYSFWSLALMTFWGVVGLGIYSIVTPHGGCNVKWDPTKESDGVSHRGTWV